jgi:hypothetical protein
MYTYPCNKPLLCMLFVIKKIMEMLVLLDVYVAVE